MPLTRRGPMTKRPPSPSTGLAGGATQGRSVSPRQRRGGGGGGFTVEAFWERVVEEARESVAPVARSSRSTAIQKQQQQKQPTDTTTAAYTTNANATDGNMGKKRKRKRKRKNRKRSDSADSTSIASEVTEPDAEVDERPRKRMALETIRETTTTITVTTNQPTTTSPPPPPPNPPLASNDSNTTKSTTRAPPSSLLTVIPGRSSKDKDTLHDHDNKDNNNDQNVLPLPPSFIHRIQIWNSSTLSAQPNATTAETLIQEPLVTTMEPESKGIHGSDDKVVEHIHVVEQEKQADVGDIEQHQVVPRQYKWMRHLHRVLVWLGWSYAVVIMVMASVGYHHRHHHDSGARLQRRIQSSSSLYPWLRVRLGWSPSPIVTCYRNNVRTTVPYLGACALDPNVDPETALIPCPKHALCWGGAVHDCRFGGTSSSTTSRGGSVQNPNNETAMSSLNYFEVQHDPVSNQKYCRMTDLVTTTFAEIVHIVETWTMARACGIAGQLDDKIDGIQFPEPAWWDASMDKEENDDRGRPMFVLTDVTKQLGGKSLGVKAPPPFQVNDAQEALHFVQMVLQELQEENHHKNNIVLSTMARRPVDRSSPWLGGPRRKNATKGFAVVGRANANQDSHVAVPAGTPLIGLQNIQSWRKGWLPLSWQCRWNGMSSTSEALTNHHPTTTTTTTAMATTTTKTTTTKAETKTENKSPSSKPKQEKEERKAVARVNKTKNVKRDDNNNNTIKRAITGTRDKIATSINKKRATTSNSTAMVTVNTSSSSTKQWRIFMSGNGTMGDLPLKESSWSTWGISTTLICFLVSMIGLAQLWYGFKVLEHVQRAVAVAGGSLSEPSIPQEGGSQPLQNTILLPKTAEQLHTDPPSFDDSTGSSTSTRQQGQEGPFSWRKFVKTSEDVRQAAATPSPPRRQSPRKTSRKTTLQVAYQG